MRQLLASSFGARAALLALALALAGALAGNAPAVFAQAAAGRAEAPKVYRNVYAAGGEVRPAAPVKGDFVAAAGRVTVDQPVGGDATLAGGAIDIRAAVGDDVRAAGGDVNVESSVGGELFAVGGNVAVRPGASVGGRARLYGGQVSVGGRIDGDLQASAQKVTVAGEVRGDARIAAEQIELAPGARIGGNLHYVSGSELKRAEGVTIVGTVTREQPDTAPHGPRHEGWDGRAGAAAWAGGVFSYVALLACAAVFILVAPVFGPRAAQRMAATPWLALAVGFGCLFAVPMLAVLLFITLLGIPLGIAVMALYPVLLLAGFIVGVLFIARLLPPALRRPHPATFGGSVGFAALALLLMMLVARIPFVGPLAMLLVSLGGIGACVLELYGRRKGPGAAPGEGTPAGPERALPDGTPRHA